MSLHSRLLFELGLRLIPLLVKAGLAILGIATHASSSSPTPLNLCPSLMAFCPATHVINGALAFLSLTLQSALHYAHIPSLLTGPIQVAFLAVSALASTAFSWLTGCSAEQLCSCAVALLFSAGHSALLHHLLALVLLS